MLKKSVFITHSPKLNLQIALLFLLLASIACKVDVGGPERPGQLIHVDPEKATDVAQGWSQAITEATSSGQVTVLFTEEQITGFVMQRLQADPTPLLKEPQIYLRQGQIQVYGIFERGIFKAAALVRVEPSIDGDGQLTFRLVEAKVGPVPAPELLMESISAVLTEALTGSIGSFATGIRIRSLAISDGEMSIVGEIR
ncbi:MAG: hypothetical protein E4G99_05830 [Anaerolineales bacterium]|nr:MAG: hypothetical protein E4G99_05830 [Anaerolineales bacterium]